MEMQISAYLLKGFALRALVLGVVLGYDFVPGVECKRWRDGFIVGVLATLAGHIALVVLSGVLGPTGIFRIFGLATLTEGAVLAGAVWAGGLKGRFVEVRRVPGLLAVSFIVLATEQLLRLVLDPLWNRW